LVGQKIFGAADSHIPLVNVPEKIERNELMLELPNQVRQKNRIANPAPSQSHLLLRC
jgi:hypothetical protein